MLGAVPPTSPPPPLAPQSLGIDPVWGRGRDIRGELGGETGPRGLEQLPIQQTAAGWGPLPDLGASGVLTQISRFVL